MNVEKVSDSEAEITLKNADEIPNKDFSFLYDVASDIPQIGFLTHKVSSENDGYFVLIAEPQKAPKQTEIRNKEIVFVLDTSGSMQGRPIETVKKAMTKAIANLGPNDRFNVYSFNTEVTTLFAESQIADDTAKKAGLIYVENLQAGGGTMMQPPFEEALKDSGDHSDRVRIILGMTDGDVGNESEILSTVQNKLGANRLFMFGVDAAANRYLIDTMAANGNGKATYVLSEDNVDEKVDAFYDTFAAPVLTDIQIDWDGLTVSEVLPEKFADLYAGQPLYVYGKYSAG
ncbi:MAG TPA: VWA domain-containing protein [bacterium]|nr:VWA domain-containing protein [bacterium]